MLEGSHFADPKASEIAESLSTAIERKAALARAFRNGCPFMRSVIIASSDLFSSNVKHSHRQIVGVMFKYTNKSGWCCVSVQRLVADLGKDRRHVIRALHEMHELGYFVREKFKKGWGYVFKRFVVHNSVGKDVKNISRRDSESPERDKGVDSPAVTESVAAVVPQTGTKKVTRGPLYPWGHDKQRARNGWLSRLGRYLAAVRPEELGRFWTEATRPPAEARRYLNAVDTECRSSNWWLRGRLTAD